MQSVCHGGKRGPVARACLKVFFRRSTGQLRLRQPTESLAGAGKGVERKFLRVAQDDMRAGIEAQSGTREGTDSASKEGGSEAH